MIKSSSKKTQPNEKSLEQRVTLLEKSLNEQSKFNIELGNEIRNIIEIITKTYHLPNA